jgi:hypothetical protein
VSTLSGLRVCSGHNDRSGELDPTKLPLTRNS